METIAAVRLFSVRRWAAPVHRECICADGSNADSGDHRAEVSIAAGGESSRGAAGVDYAEAAARCACHAGVAGKIFSQAFIQRETICCRRLNFFPPKKEPQQKFRRELDQLLAGRKGAEFGARLHHAKNGIARDDANDLGRAVAGAAHDGHLIDVRA